ncbi:MAG: ABC transporter permease [Eubacteriales bacterium]|nr:ABC transporter permease [Eubacteriales bacterium]
MLGKLAFRNMKRSAGDYLVYTLTMTVVTALMYAFNSLIFQNVIETSEMAIMMKAMLGMATVFIVLIVAWLINYMVHFMLEKRSAEFGIYMLLGMKKKTISRLYMRENILLGTLSFIVGVPLGILFQQVLLAVMSAMVYMEYKIQISFNIWTILMTVLCYGGCYLLALISCKRKFRRMNISSLMNAKRKNEEIKEKHESVKRILFPLSVLFILAFWALFGSLSSVGEILFFLIGLVLTIYLFFTGISAWIICYVRKHGNGIYKGQNLFLLRQFASKVRTMQFTMGTLTSLFTLALMGASVALMFSSYETTVLKGKFPFDIQIYSSDPQADFKEEKKIIEQNTNLQSFYSYHIYTDETDQANRWMLTNNQTAWGGMYVNKDGSPKEKEIREMLEKDGTYYRNDTYMGISDYNHLREILGYEGVELGGREYLIHMKPRLGNELKDMAQGITVTDADGKDTLVCKGIYTEYFSQDGHNGADYVIVVPDEVLGRMKPYYSELTAEIKGQAPKDLQLKLDSIERKTESEVEFLGHFIDKGLCYGSDNIVTYAAVNLVRDNLIPEVKYMLASIIIPFFYIGLVFVCVAVTVLSVQQLSDSAKHKERYEVLKKLGVGSRKIRGLVAKQLVAYYLCPALLAMVISGKMILFASGKFVLLTGVPVSAGIFFAESAALFLGIYVVYFIVTYVGFIRNIEQK